MHFFVLTEISKTSCIFAPETIKERYDTKNVTVIEHAATKFLSINKTHIIEWE